MKANLGFDRFSRNVNRPAKAILPHRLKNVPRAKSVILNSARSNVDVTSATIQKLPPSPDMSDFEILQSPLSEPDVSEDVSDDLSYAYVNPTDEELALKQSGIRPSIPAEFLPEGEEVSLNTVNSLEKAWGVPPQDKKQREIYFEATSKAHLLAALKEPLNQESEKVFKNRISYLQKSGRDYEAELETNLINNAKRSRTPLHKWKVALSSALHDKSRKFVYEAVVKHPEVIGQTRDSVLHIFTESALHLAFKYPLHEGSDRAVHEWGSYALHHGKSKEDVRIMTDYFNKQKVNLLRSHDAKHESWFPFHLNVKGVNYIVTGQLGDGEYGVVYDAHKTSDYKNPAAYPVVIKIAKNTESSQYLQQPTDDLSFKWMHTEFEREKHVLQKMHRLIADDPELLITVQNKVLGTPLDKILLSTTDHHDLWNKYNRLASDFYYSTGYIHGDIRPENVIVDNHGNLHLIDFGWTVPTANNEEDLAKNDHPYDSFGHKNHAEKLDSLTQLLIRTDEKRARAQWRLLWATQEGLKAVMHPELPESKRKFQKFLIELTNARNERYGKMIDMWTEEYIKLYHENPIVHFDMNGNTRNIMNE